jgi:hypothetical protein
VKVVAKTALNCLVFDPEMIFSLKALSDETNVLSAWDSDDVSTLLEKSSDKG